jgi:hypothetical protein
MAARLLIPPSLLHAVLLSQLVLEAEAQQIAALYSVPDQRVLTCLPELAIVGSGDDGVARGRPSVPKLAVSHPVRRCRPPLCATCIREQISREVGPCCCYCCYYHCCLVLLLLVLLLLVLLLYLLLLILLL